MCSVCSAKQRVAILSGGEFEQTTNMLTNKKATERKWEEWEERQQVEQRWQALRSDESEYA